jgi:hypothetical protein
MSNRATMGMGVLTIFTIFVLSTATAATALDEGFACSSIADPPAGGNAAVKTTASAVGDSVLIKQATDEALAAMDLDLVNLSVKMSSAKPTKPTAPSFDVVGDDANHTGRRALEGAFSRIQSKLDRPIASVAAKFTTTAKSSAETNMVLAPPKGTSFDICCFAGLPPPCSALCMCSAPNCCASEKCNK